MGELDLSERLSELLEVTRSLLNASVGVDSSEIGEQLYKRQCCIDALKAAGVPRARSTDAQMIIDKILSLDSEARDSIHKRLQKVALELNRQKQKSTGILQYSSNRFGGMSGQLLDRRK